MSTAHNVHSTSNNSQSSSTERRSSIPRPTISTNLDSYRSNASVGSATPPSSTTDILNHYSAARSPHTSSANSSRASSTVPRSFDQPPRSFSGPASSTSPRSSRSNPALSGLATRQPKSTRDLIAHFNNKIPDESHSQTSPRVSIRSSSATADSQQAQRRSSSSKLPAPTISVGHVRVQRQNPPKPGRTERVGSLSSSNTNRSPQNSKPHKPAVRDLHSAVSPPTSLLFGEVSQQPPEKSGIGFGIPPQRPRRGSDGFLNYSNATFFQVEDNHDNENPEGMRIKVNVSPDRNSARTGAAKAHQRAISDSTATSNTTSLDRFSALRNLPPTNQLQTLDERSHLANRSHEPNSSWGVEEPTVSGVKDRRPITPPTLLSYSNRGGSPHQSSRPDQHLEAIIRAPSPKRSPPLRSSRPRQQVSEATNLVRSTNDTSKLVEDIASATTLSRNLDPAPETKSSVHVNGYQEPSGSKGIEQNRNSTVDNKHASNLNDLPQLTSAVYKRNVPPLKVNVPVSSYKEVEPPQAETTDFEDDSPRSHIPGSFPTSPEEDQSLIKEDRPLPLHVRKSQKTLPDPPRHPSRSESTPTNSPANNPRDVPQSSIPSSPEEGAGTIHIMLGGSTLLQHFNLQNQQLPSSVNGGSIQIPIDLAVKDGDSKELDSPADSTKYRISKPATRTEHYNAYLRLIEEYQEKQSISPQIKRECSQYLMSADPSISQQGAEATLQDMINEISKRPQSDFDSKGVVTSGLSRTSSKIAFENSPVQHRSEKDPVSRTPSVRSPASDNQSPHPQVFATMRGSYVSSWEDYFNDPNADGTITPIREDSEDESKPEPPPKDGPRQSETRSRPTDRYSVQTLQSISSDQPSLPEIQDTGGGIGFDLQGSSSTLVSSKDTTPKDTPRSGNVLSPGKGLQTGPGSDEARNSYNTSERPSDETLPNTVSRDLSSFNSSRDGHISTDSGPLNDDDRRNDEEGRLKKRKIAIKELIDTEYSFHRDMTVVEDIYLGTAPSVGDALSADDIKTLFGNVRQITTFSQRLADALKDATRSVYVRPKELKWLNRQREAARHSSLSTSDSSQAEQLREGTDDERDRRTRVGAVFVDKMREMEKVFGEYIKNHESANKLLQKLSSVEKIKLWLNECYNYAHDITQAWNLDSLLVKPTQRFLKYHILLEQLVKHTPQDHPDYEPLKAAHRGAIEVSANINESKKRAELLEQVMNDRGRKDTDISRGLVKAFGRRKDKLRQQVGLTEALEDPQYKAITQRFNGHVVQIEVVAKDVEKYKTDVEAFAKQYLQLVEAVEETAEVQPSAHPEIESKWRKFGHTVRDLTSIAFSDHLADVQKHVVEPIETLYALHGRPQELIKDHKQRLPEYARYKTIVDRREKPDKKIAEQGERFLALDSTLKDELPRLFMMSARLIEACLKNFVDLIARFQRIWQNKLFSVLDEPFEQALALENSPDPTITPKFAGIVRAFRRDYEYAEGDILGLGICNGAYLAGSSNFLSSTASLNQEGASESHRPSTNSRRATSTSSQTSPAPQDYLGRGSGQSLGVSPHHTNARPSTESGGLHSNGQFQQHQRIRSASGTAMPRPQPQPINQTGTPATKRHDTSDSSGTFFFGHSPGPTPPLSTANAGSYESAGTVKDSHHRPSSASTFYTAKPESQPNSQAYQQYTSSPPVQSPGVFSSAVPAGGLARPGRTGISSRQTSAGQDYRVLFLAVSLFEFNIDRARKEAGFPYLTYVPGEIFDVIGEKGELWLAKNQDDTTNTLGWIWEKHFTKLPPNES